MNYQPGYWPCWACATYQSASEGVLGQSASEGMLGVCDDCQLLSYKQLFSYKSGCNFKKHFYFAPPKQIIAWLAKNSSRVQNYGDTGSELQLLTLAMHYESTTNEEEKQQ